ncbi:MAG: threonine/serine dehydratase [candidate division KSB1 bacterium]|nr:threonine/serine dehydratase [candidate division KSB1 bacterium]MDZ7275884.1 threonine/serine dehydratase [candidate division KSB1 bacterium]MDZ7287634.1 threonine/serine dehydratase [candidate division KSB1 bacterium]MDZ7306796.1 threonine/serine dehydratase [candidate division KSB1 bacterium]MDZ7350612.1 threonine/serine dehydratase [candidate division KSB1 bacterium]
MNDLAARVLQAAGRLQPHVKETPLEYSLPLSQDTGCEVYLKLENLQHTGSFKARGALNKMLALDPAQAGRGVVAASTGNHGAAVAFAGRKLGIKPLIFVPDNASPAKLAAIRRLGAEIRVHGHDSVITEIFAREYARENSLIYISPYNDEQVIAGQGTIGVEMARQHDHLEAVFVALGGGGMIAGIAASLKAVWPGVRVIGCSPRNSCVMIASVKAGRIVELESLPTLSDGTAGGVEADAITLPLCRTLVDDYVTVTEEEIGATLLWFIETHHQLIEGAAAVALGGFLQQAHAYRGRPVAVVICGGNISLATLRQLLCGAAPGARLLAR